MRRLFFLLICAVQFSAQAEESWQTALSRMPLGTDVTQLNRSNCVQIMLRALQASDTVKGLVFMPGATDEFYMFRRAKASLTNGSPTLLDAVNALTNQTLIQATFRPPLLLLHTTEDALEPLAEIKNTATAYRLEGAPFVPHALYYDRDWDFLLPILKSTLDVRLSPQRYSRSSWHFYRHSFAGWNLNGWEALEAISLAGKTRFTVERNHLVFDGDVRFMAVPKFDHFPE